MEALAAVSLASAVVGFVDFTVKVISKSNKYYESATGTLAEHVEFQGLADNFAELSRGLTDSLFALPKAKGLSDDEKALRTAATECLSIARELRETLDQLRVLGEHRKWKSFHGALKAYWSKDKIERTVAKLTHAREHLVVNLLVVICNRQKSEIHLLLDDNKRLEEKILDAINKSRLQAAGLVADLSASLDKVTREERSRVLENWQNEHRDDMTKIERRFTKAAEDEQRRQLGQFILHDLDFPQLKERYAMIPKAHVATFEWILEGESAQTARKTNFVYWLKNVEPADSLFWITGKAGSGKSTLMRYLWDNPRTKEFLREWAGTKELVLASCFFWNPGTQMQKSQIGLLRSLLFQLLSQNLDLIEGANPWRWRSHKSGALNIAPWTVSELVDAFEYVIKNVGAKAKACFFIDGLDEFDGDDAARAKIITLLLEASRFSNVKVCVSSRPWLIFEDAFKCGPSLQLHHVTYNDIRNYVQIELVDSERFLILKEREDSGCSELAFEIVEKAMGVFLWVVLVVRDLLQCLQNGDGISDLRRKLRSLPSDLDKYFAKMMSTLDEFYLEQACELFQVAIAATDQLSLLTYSYIHDEGDFDPLKARVEAASALEVSSRCENMERRLNSRCKGLLEVHQTSNHHIFFNKRIDFLHRTVRDFLRTDVLRNMLQSFRGKEVRAPVFDVELALCRSFLAQIKALDFVIHDQDPFKRLLKYCLSYARRYECLTNASLTVLLDNLNQSITTLFETYRRFDPGDHWTNLLQSIQVYFEDDYNLYSISSNVIHTEDVGSETWWFHKREWRSTFASFALSQDLKIYFKEKLVESPSMIREKQGRPLLDYVSRPSHLAPWKVEALVPDIELLRLLLKQGADPNQQFDSSTVWGHFVNFLSGNSKKFEAPQWFQATHLLIEYGAQQNIEVVGPPENPLGKHRLDSRCSIDIIRSVFDGKEAMELESMFQRRRRHERARIFKTLFTWTHTK